MPRIKVSQNHILMCLTVAPDYQSWTSSSGRPCSAHNKPWCLAILLEGGAEGGGAMSAGAVRGCCLELTLVPPYFILCGSPIQKLVSRLS